MLTCREATQDNPNLLQQGTWFSKEGSSSPLGVTWIEEEAAFNFALYSKGATEVVLLLCSEPGLIIPTYEYGLDPFANKSGHVWHCRIRAQEIPMARYYAYRVFGAEEQFDRRKCFSIHMQMRLFSGPVQP